MRVLAIDPGYGRCGVAVLEKNNGKETLVYSNCVETGGKDFPERLDTVIRACTTLIEEYAPHAIALEKLFFNVNQKTAMRVAEVRGALIEMATAHKLPVFEYTPGEVKVAVGGFGRADKTSVAKMLIALLKITKKISHDDVYDAIAVGVTYLAHARQ